MTESIVESLLAFAGGLLLGAFFFGGLWLTVQRATTSRFPALLALASFLLRTAVVLIGFYFLMGGQWPQAIFALGGFIVARVVLIHRFGAQLFSASPGKEWVKHEQ